MADFSVDQIDAVQSGTATADTLKKVANVARNAACGFFNSYAQIVIPNPAFDYLDSLWDGLCKNSSSGLPPAPAPPFIGGQCATQYQVHYSFDLYNGTTLANHIDNTATINGKINDIILTNVSGSSVGVQIDFTNFFTGNPAQFNDKYGFAPTFSAKNLNIISIVRSDGNPDNCGNLPSTYPPPVTPPTPITPGGSTYNLPNVNVTLNNGLTFNVTPQLNLNASFNPVLQIGGINISFGGGGVTVGPPPGTPPATPSIDPTNLLNKILKNLGDGTIAGGGVGGAAAGAKKNTDPPPKPGAPGTNPPVTKPPTTKTSKNITGLSSVQIIITTPPVRVEIFAADTSYNVFIAGWFQWLQGDLPLERLPIQNLNTIWFAPPGTDGYTYTLTNGGVGHSVESTLSS